MATISSVLYLPTVPPAALSVLVTPSASSELSASPSSGIVDKPETLQVKIAARSEAVTASAIVERNNKSSDRLCIVLEGTSDPDPSELDVAVGAEETWKILLWWFNNNKNQRMAAAAGKPQGEHLVELLPASGGSSLSPNLVRYLEKLGLLDIEVHQDGSVERYIVYSKNFWQTPPALFISSSNPHRYPSRPVRYLISNGVRHPKRPFPPAPKQSFYTRHCEKEGLNSVFSLRPTDLSDVATLHRWMNNPRVAEFWGEEGPLEHQKKFLETCMKSTHSFTAIGSWNDLDSNGDLASWRDACFFDFYWVKEDRLSRYIDNPGDWDRGVHLLVGEDWARGRSSAWLSSIVQYMFLDDARTQSIYLEPRVDNVKFIRLLTNHGFYKVKDFAFPHKQAALMKLDRESWVGCI